MKKYTAVLAGTALALALMSAAPRTAGAARAGDVEIGVQLGGNGDVVTNLLPVVFPYFAVFVNDSLSLGGSAFYSSGSAESEDYTTLGIDLLGRYNIDLGKKSDTIPFVEGGFRYFTLDVEGTVTKYNAIVLGGGARYRLVNNVYTNFKLNYSIGKAEDMDVSAFTISAGLSLLL